MIYNLSIQPIDDLFCPTVLTYNFALFLKIFGGRKVQTTKSKTKFKFGTSLVFPFQMIFFGSFSLRTRNMVVVSNGYTYHHITKALSPKLNFSARFNLTSTIANDLFIRGTQFVCDFFVNQCVRVAYTVRL